MSYQLEHYFILKAEWDTWAAINNTSENYEAILTPDGVCYAVAINANNNEARVQLKSVPSAVRVERSNLNGFQSDNAYLFDEPDTGASPVARKEVVHPTTSAGTDMAFFYNGTVATLNYLNPSDSVWTFPPNYLKGGLNDVFKNDNFILVPKSGFGPGDPPNDLSPYIERGNAMFIKVWTIVSAIESSGNIVVTLTIPTP